MKIGFVRVFVADFDKSLDFYTKTLGLLTLMEEAP